MSRQITIDSGQEAKLYQILVEAEATLQFVRAQLTANERHLLGDLEKAHSCVRRAGDMIFSRNAGGATEFYTATVARCRAATERGINCGRALGHSGDHETAILDTSTVITWRDR